jgi:hypothetical protein
VYDSHRKKRVKKEYDRDDDGQSYADNQVANAIRDYADTQMRAEVAKQKLWYMEAEDSCQEKKLLLLEWDKLQANLQCARTWMLHP